MFENSVFLVLSAIYWRSSWKYGDPGYRYVQQDIGHAFATAAAAAKVQQHSVFLLDHLTDDDIATLYGGPRGEEGYGGIAGGSFDVGAQHPVAVLAIVPDGIVVRGRQDVQALLRRFRVPSESNVFEKTGRFFYEKEFRVGPAAVQNPHIREACLAAWKQHHTVDHSSPFAPNAVTAAEQASLVLNTSDACSAAVTRTPSSSGNKMDVDSFGASGRAAECDSGGMSPSSTSSRLPPPLAPAALAASMFRRRSSTGYDGRTAMMAAQFLDTLARLMPNQWPFDTFSFSDAGRAEHVEGHILRFRGHILRYWVDLSSSSCIFVENCPSFTYVGREGRSRVV